MNGLKELDLYLQENQAQFSQSVLSGDEHIGTSRVRVNDPKHKSDIFASILKAKSTRQKCKRMSRTPRSPHLKRGEHSSTLHVASFIYLSTKSTSLCVCTIFVVHVFRYVF